MLQPAVSSSSPVGPSRRALISAAAWTVPVVTVASATPAFATTPPSPTDPVPLAALSPTATIVSNADQTQSISGSVVINNPTNIPTTGLQVVFVIPAAYTPVGVPPVTVGSTIGTWTITHVVTRTDGTITATLTASTQLAPASSTTITFDVTALMPRLPSPAPAVSVRPSTTNATIAPEWVAFTPGRA